MTLIGRPFRVAAAGGFDVANAIHLNASASQYFSKTFGAGDQKTWTYSTVVRRGALSTRQTFGLSASSAGTAYFQFDVTTDLLHIYAQGASGTLDWTSTQVFRDPGAPGHLVIHLDTTHATTNSRCRVWWNGEEITAWTRTSTPAQNDTLDINAAVAHYIGRQMGSTNYFDGNLAETIFVDGQALDATSFGEFDGNGVWRPIKFSPTGTTAAATGAYVGANYIDSNVTTYTFTSEPIGAAPSGSETRLVVVGVVLSHDVTAARSVSSMTIGGVTAKRVIQKNDDSASWYSVEQWAAEVPTGTTATIVVTANAACQQCIIFVYRLIDAEIYPAKQAYDASGATLTADLPTVANSFSVGIYMDRQRSHTVTWTGLTEDAEETGTEVSAGVMGSSASATNVSAGNVTVTTTPSAGTDNFTMVLANYGPKTGYGTNGFYINDASGADQSGKGNDWTPVNTPTDTADTPTTIYATLDPVWTSAATYSDGNLKASVGQAHRATIAIPDGDWYWEPFPTTATGGGAGTGIVNATAVPGNYLGQDAYGWAYESSGQKRNAGSLTSYGSAYTAGSTQLCVAVKRVAGVASIWFGQISGGTITWQNSGDPVANTGAAFTGITGDIFPAGSTQGVYAWAYNFGATDFAATTLPTGFVALNSANIYAADPPAIEDGSAHFQSTTYTGNGTAIGSGGKVVTQTGNSTFTPDLVWVKARSSAENHNLADIVRGATKIIRSNLTSAEDTQTESIATFNSDGFTVGNYSNVNTNAVTHVGWQWKAGGAGVSNTDGSITSTVSANPTAGQSVVTYTGTGANATVGHGLGVAPTFVIVKGRDDVSNWRVYHQSIGATKTLFLSTTGAADTNSVYWNDTAPSSTVISLGANTGGTNNTGVAYVAYSYTDKPGYSKFGSYTGNGSADGPFIYLGFKPAFVMCKRTDSAGSEWNIIDNARPTYNPGAMLFPDTAGVENSTYPVDLLSNGFKWRSATYNASGGTYIYAAFAEVPSYGLTPAKAR